LIKFINFQVKVCSECEWSNKLEFEVQEAGQAPPVISNISPYQAKPGRYGNSHRGQF